MSLELLKTAFKLGVEASLAVLAGAKDLAEAARDIHTDLGRQ